MIFEDPKQRRWRYTLISLAAVLATALLIGGLVLLGLIVPPPIPDTFSSHKLLSPAKMREDMEREIKPRFTKQQLARLERLRARTRWRRELLVRDARQGAMPLEEGTVVAFVLDEDPASIASLEAHLANLDVVIPDWFELPGPDCSLIEKVSERTRRLLSRTGALVIPRMANFYRDKWRGAETGKFLRSYESRTCVVKKLGERLQQLDVEGLNLDLEDLAPEDSEYFLEFIVELRRELHARGMRLTVDVPFQDPAFDYEYIGQVADAVMVMAYDEHFPSSAPGPLASRPWLEMSLDNILPRIPPERLVLILGSYGYDWDLDEKGKLAEGISFLSATNLARAAGNQPVFVENLENGYFAYRDNNGHTHEVWFQDALSLWNQILLAKANKINRFGLWRLGTEDETIWMFFGADQPPQKPYVLGRIPASNSVEFYGTGEVLTTRTRPHQGERIFLADDQGRILKGVYIDVPTGYMVERRGGEPKKVVFTFDDGPNELWTPQVLDILKKFNIKAVFFVVGEEVMRFPHLVERAAEEGHLIGNHTFTHPHLEDLTRREARAQLSSNQRLIEGLVGKRSPLFRVPYTADVIIDDEKGLAPMRIGLEEGYLVVGANVDSLDWKLLDAQAIADRVFSELERGAGQIVLFHDGGGDRRATIEALRLLVPRLREHGYKIVSLEELLRVPRHELEQPLEIGERVLSWSNAFLAWLRSWCFTLVAVLFLVCTVLASLRILFLGALVFMENFYLRRQRKENGQDYRPLVSVIIPAFNEERVIASTLEALRRTDYPSVEFMVIDDGSQDQTAEVVRKIAQEDARVRLLQQKNSGKAAAANYGLREARGEIVVAVDADTIVSPQSISLLVRHFADPEVVAVCGNVEVGNVNSWLTAFQAVEYVTSQNFDRRAFSALNCISVVPGALGAWRREAVLAAGGYSADTLTEDADLTLTLLRRGGRIVYEAGAIGRTEAPENLRGFLKQRFRWTYGAYQCLWKHRRAFFKGTLGWIGLPNMVLFQILFPALSPLGDLLMVWSIIRGEWSAFLSGYLAFLFMDVCASLLAFWLDKKPKWWLLLLLVQRFSYRQIMYYVSLRSMVAALRGLRYSWRKLERRGSVKPVLGPAQPNGVA